ncbi:cell division ATP-binding protein FtsE [Candidatus Parcubacteria bacterium A4]|nr:MAG: cell division ATP-binding protein FtsE [Candidatus Parcubacteria bacterium A4]
MISFESVTKLYSSKKSKEPTVALENVSLEIKPKEFVSIVGRSGSGKTTLLKIILAEEKPTSGAVFFEGYDIHKLKMKDLPFYRRKMGAIFQDYKLLCSKTVYENIAFVMQVIGAGDAEIKKDIPKVLEIVNLTEKANNYPAELSGGEKQRVAIARALIHRPGVILADEPTGNLDPYNVLEIINLLVKIQQMGTTVILASHNKDVVNSIGKRVITLEKGRIIRDEENGRFIL